ncbi:hypothetical protein ACFL5Z_10160 [Planctomycetota bacterium]
MESSTQAEYTPGRRLITHNLIVSAAQFELEERVQWSTIEDLCALIDIFCLYDSAVLIGDPELNAVKELNIIGLLEDTHFIREDKCEDESGRIPETVATAAAKHLAAFLGQDLTAFWDKVGLKVWLDQKYNEMIPDHLKSHFTAMFQWEEHRKALVNDPNLYERVHKEVDHRAYARRMMSHVLRTSNIKLMTVPDSPLPTPENLLDKLIEEGASLDRDKTFNLRTFLYIGYADTHNIAFTPDVARRPTLEKVLSREEEFRGLLLSKLKDPVVETTPGDKELLRRVSPLAMVVFERAGRDSKRILNEMRSLRDDLKSSRAKLAELEYERLNIFHDNSVKVKSKWDNVLKEVERNFGTEPNLFTSRHAISFSQIFGRIINDPFNFQLWREAIVKLPIGTIRRLLGRHTLIEIHSIRPELPAAGRLINSIKALFDPY